VKDPELLDFGQQLFYCRNLLFFFWPEVDPDVISFEAPILPVTYPVCYPAFRRPDKSLHGGTCPACISGHIRYRDILPSIPPATSSAKPPSGESGTFFFTFFYSFGQSAGRLFMLRRLLIFSVPSNSLRCFKKNLHPCALLRVVFYACRLLKKFACL
jgi:hypothetical protein